MNNYSLISDKPEFINIKSFEDEWSSISDTFISEFEEKYFESVDCIKSIENFLNCNLSNIENFYVKKPLLFKKEKDNVIALEFNIPKHSSQPNTICHIELELSNIYKIHDISFNIKNKFIKYGHWDKDTLQKLDNKYVELMNYIEDMTSTSWNDIISIYV